MDFDLSIQRDKEGYRARVLMAPCGEASGDFTLPFSELEIENLLLRIGRRRSTVRRIDSPEVRVAKLFGEKLFRAAFPESVRDCLRGSLDAASSQGAGLRLRLRLNEVPELADLPWEYLWDPSHKRFLALSTDTPIVRYLDVPERIRPLVVQPPLQILTLFSSPIGFPKLDTEREWNRLNEALGPLIHRGLVALDRLERPTLMELRRRLRQRDYHIFHFVGHGGFETESQDGVLALEDETGRSRLVSGQDIAVLLQDRRTLRLAVLNACEGARASRTDPFAGTAQSLVQGGIPAVIAMQFEISDQAAITFSSEFYQALGEGFPVDTALSEARLAIFAEDNGLEWGTPVLYLRATDGQIFDIAGTSALQALAELRTKPAPPVLPSLEPEPKVAEKSEFSSRIEQRPTNLPREKVETKNRPEPGSWQTFKILAAVLALTLIGFAAWVNRTKSSDPLQNDRQMTTPPAAPAAPAADAGGVTGTVTFAGTDTDTPIAFSLDPVCASLHASTPADTNEIAAKDGKLGNVLVYVKTGLEGKTLPVPAEKKELDQKGCLYTPHVQGIQTGQALTIKNTDATLHNVHALATVNPEFNQAQPQGLPPFDKTFDKQEVIHVKCDVHPWMSAYVAVMPHPFFATSGDDGSYTIKGLPPGKYTLEAWHEKLGTQTQEITVASNQTVAANFDFKGK
ncbi:MAG TPA: CHAT domain-containing protein [Thermoanaerobaculia bacterium]|nr:CHAT domain-containing protein [Thermoanaerobaculia bacterium]